MADRNGYIGRAPADSSIIIARQEYTPSGVTTDFTFNSSYIVGYIDAYLNGARLIEASDYTATDGSTVSLTTAAEDGDVLELVAYKAFNATNVTDASGNFTVGTDLTVGGSVGISSNVDVTGIVTAGEFSGDGSSLSGISTGVSINAAGGALQRVILANTTSGVANTMANTGSLYWNDNTSTLYATNVNISGTTTTEDTQNVDSTGIVTAGLGFRATLGGLVVTAGVSTFTPYPAIDANEEVQVGASIQLGKAGIVTALGLDISTGGVDVDGQTDLDELQVAGVSTFSAKAVFNTAYPSVDADNEVQVGTAIQLGKAGVITATSFSGSGANLTDVVSGISLQQAGSWITGSTGNPGGATPGTAATTFNFASGATLTEVSSGITTITIAAGGVSTEAHVVTTEGVVNLNLGSAQDHKLTASGIVTVTCNGGTEGESHTLRITNSGVSTVGFSTYFLWPSGGAPSIPSTDGTLSLISFTIQTPGAVGLGTQLLAGASVDFS